jgi:hypothetical protein
MTSTIGIPIKLLNEATVRSTDSLLSCTLSDCILTSLQGHVVTIEISSGQVYRGKLIEGVSQLSHPRHEDWNANLGSGGQHERPAQRHHSHSSRWTGISFRSSIHSGLTCAILHCARHASVCRPPSDLSFTDANLETLPCLDRKTEKDGVWVLQEAERLSAGREPGKDRWDDKHEFLGGVWSCMGKSYH